MRFETGRPLARFTALKAKIFPSGFWPRILSIRWIFLEALTFCQALDKQPQTVIIGIEPEDIKTVGLEMTPAVVNKMPAMVEMVILELAHLGVEVSGRPLTAENDFKENQTPGIPKI
jgi:Ni,Fe-hydrogenase maturation factor